MRDDAGQNQAADLAIAGPLLAVIGTRIISSTSFVLNTDLPTFDLDVPNESGGCQGVLLQFSSGELELDWDWSLVTDSTSEDFRGATVYHLAVRSSSVRSSAAASAVEGDGRGIAAVDATESILWRSVHGETLCAATVWGLRRYGTLPQGVSLEFGPKQIAVFVGMSNPFTVGDGDELLVFDDADWKAEVGGLGEFLVPLWSSNVNTLT